MPADPLTAPALPGNPPTALAEIAALAPAALGARLSSLAADLHLAYAANTQRAWRASWRVWRTFCEARAVPVLPASLDTLREFLNARIDVGRRRTTLEVNLATLALVHRLAGLSWVLESLEGRLMWRGLRRTRLTARPRQKHGVTLAELERMVAALSAEQTHDVRDAALLRVGFETLLRRSELVSLTVDNLVVEADGTGSIVLARSKTDQEGEGARLYLSTEAIARVQRWRSLAGLTKGLLFRAIPRRAGPPTFERPLQDRDVARIYQRRARAVGIEASQVAGHSLRIGATQDLLAAGFSGIEVQRQGRWKTERMVIRYGEKLAVRRSAMARLLRARGAEAGATAPAGAAPRSSARSDSAEGD